MWLRLVEDLKPKDMVGEVLAELLPCDLFAYFLEVLRNLSLARRIRVAFKVLPIAFDDDDSHALLAAVTALHNEIGIDPNGIKISPSPGVQPLRLHLPCRLDAPADTPIGPALQRVDRAPRARDPGPWLIFMPFGIDPVLLISPNDQAFRTDFVAIPPEHVQLLVQAES